MPQASLDYAARLDDVLEVSLRGVADAAFWQTYLAPFGLKAAHGEAAAVRISAASARFRGLAFREVSVAVSIAPPPGAHDLPHHVFLTCAVNSNRLFAFVERTVFSTPYAFAHCAIEAAPVRVLVERGGRTLLRFGQNAHTKRAIRTDAAAWHGTVSLPPAAPGSPAARYFIAEIEGEATVTPFAPKTDRFSVAATDAAPFALLADSGFEPREWIVRRGARHAKSKTYQRSDV